MANALCAPSGEVDLCTIGVFRDALYDNIDECGAPSVHVDLAAVSFMDSAGYHALIDANEYAFRHGRTMVIRNLNAQCARLIGLCDWDNELRVETNRYATPAAPALKGYECRTV